MLVYQRVTFVGMVLLGSLKELLATGHTKCRGVWEKRTSLGPENLGRWVSWKTEEMVTFCQVCYDESYIYI